MLDLRLKGLKLFRRKPMPGWGADLSGIDFQSIKYLVRSTEKQAASWDDVPAAIKGTFERIGIPEAERQALAGVGAQYETEDRVPHHQRGPPDRVSSSDPDTALSEHPDLLQKYFGTVIPDNDNKFAALNTAVWSGGSFVYVPKGVQVDVPLQAYFRINAGTWASSSGPSSSPTRGPVHYVEGCTAPIYSTDSLHSAVVEIIAHAGGTPRSRTGRTMSTTWSRSGLATGASMEWMDGNIGSR